MIVARTIAILLAGSLVFAGFRTGHASNLLVEDKVRCPDEITTTGYYRNHSYDFSISIPSGLKGFWNSARCVKDERDCICMGDHGRFIPVDRYSYLQVFVSTQNSETTKETIDEEIESRLATHKQKKAPAVVITRAPARLDGVWATRLTLRYRDTKTRQIMLEDSIICAPVDPDHGGWLYTISLATPEMLYPKRKALFYSIIKSWRFRTRA